MAVTTKNYTSSTSRAKDILQSLHDAIGDLGWFEPQPYGYLCTFVNTPGSTLKNQALARYLVNPTVTSATTGTEAVFDVARSPTGSIAAVTLVTGGQGYYIRGLINISTVGTTMTVPDSTGINVGMVVTKLAGTGTLQSNTVVTGITNSTTITIDQSPSVNLSGATCTFADTVTIDATSIGGNSYVIASTASNNSTTINISTVTDTQNIFIGQVVTGTNIGSLVTVTAISGTQVTISKATLGIVSGNLTFSDQIIATTTGIANIDFATGTASGLTITNVGTSANLYVGAEITLLSGTPTWDASNGRVFISSISGSGPYTVTLRNEENTFKGFTTSGSITFSATPGANVKWFAVDNYTSPTTYGWAVAKIKNANSGKLRNTFWAFYVGFNTALYNSVILYIKPMTGFNPVTNVAQGVSNLDWFSAAGATSAAGSLAFFTVASSPFVSTTLRVRKSGVDTNFATFSFFEGNNTRSPFFISKYNTATQPWSLDDMFLGGCYEIFQLTAFNTNDTGIVFRLRMNGIPKRMAEAGYGNYNLAATAVYTNTYYRTLTGNRIQAAPVAAYDDVALYSRQYGDIQTSVVTTYPIYKNIPINPHFLPVPYYLPEDFVLIELPWLNAAIGDTVTVSVNEIYTIIQVATNQLTFTSLALAVRTT